MAQSPYNLLTIASSAFTGTAIATIDLGGLYRKLQVSLYTSSNAVIPGDLNAIVEKRQDANIPQYPYDGSAFTYEGRILNQGFSTTGTLYLPTPAREAFYRYVTATITGTSSGFTAGTATVVLSFSGCEWPS